MDIKIIVFALATFFHDVFTVIWMGGLLITVISFMPAVRETLGAGPPVKKVMQAFQKRQSVWVYISMGGLIVTGLMLSKHSSQFEHLFAFNNTFVALLSIKHILVILLICLSLVRALILGQSRSNITPQKEHLSRMILILNILLAVAVLLASGFMAALDTPLPV